MKPCSGGSFGSRYFVLYTELRVDALDCPRAWVNEHRYPKRVVFECNQLFQEGWEIRCLTPGRLLLWTTRESVAVQIPEGFPFVAPTILPARAEASWSADMHLGSWISRSASAASEP